MIRVSLLVLTAVIAFEMKANALTVYSDRSAWEAAVSSFATEDFNSIAVDTGEYIQFPTSADTSSSLFFFPQFGDFTVTYASDPPEAGVLVDVPPYAFAPGTADIDGTARVNLGGISSNSVVGLIFNQPIVAFGMDTANDDGGNHSAVVSVDGDVIGTFPENRGDTGFIGVASEEAFLEVQIRGAEGDIDSTFNAFDNVSYAFALKLDPEAVPEPGSMLIWLLLGAALIGAKQNWRKDAAT